MLLLLTKQAQTSYSLSRLLKDQCLQYVLPLNPILHGYQTDFQSLLHTAHTTMFKYVTIINSQKVW